MSSINQFSLDQLEGRRLFSAMLAIDDSGLSSDSAPPAPADSSDAGTTDDGSGGVANPVFVIFSGATNEGGQGGLVDLGDGVIGLGGVNPTSTQSHVPTGHHKHHGKGLTQFQHPPKPSKVSGPAGFTIAKGGFGLRDMFSGVLIS